MEIDNVFMKSKQIVALRYVLAIFCAGVAVPEKHVSANIY